MKVSVKKRRAFYVGPLLAICWCAMVFAGDAGELPPLALQRLSLKGLIHRVQNPDLSEDDRHILGKELEDRVATTVAEVESLLALIGEQKGEIRQKAINAVSNTLDPSLKSVFIKGITDANPLVNAVSAGMCGKLRIREAADDLVKLVKRLGPVAGVVKSDQERASIAAVLALGEIGDESTIPFLVGLFQKMRGYEVMALIKYGKKVVPAMFEVIASTDKDFVRQQAERVLLSLRDPGAIPLFEKEVENPDSPFRSISMRVLLNTDPNRTLPRFLQSWLEKGNSDIISLVLGHIDFYQMTDSRYGPFVVKILSTATDDEFRRMAASILGRIGGNEAKEALKEALKDKDPLVRAFAARSLQSLKHK